MARKRPTAASSADIGDRVEWCADFRVFAGLLPISLKDGGSMPFTYDRWHLEQREYHRARTLRDIILKARQIGFTTEELARDVWFALRHSDVQVLVVSHEPALCEQLFRVVTRMVNELVRLGLIPSPLASSVREVLFSHNRSAIRIVEAGATTRVADKRGRSGTVHRLHATELAHWGAPEATMSAVLGACAPNAEIVIESTANGATNGGYHKAWLAAVAGTSGYTPHFWPWYVHAEYRVPTPLDFDPEPRDEHERAMRALGVDDQQIAWWRARCDDPMRGGLDRVLQEYPYAADLAFRVPGGRWLAPSLTDWLVNTATPRKRTERIGIRLRRDGMDPKHWPKRDLGEALVFVEPDPRDPAVIGCDCGGGGGADSDATAIRVRSKRTGRLLCSLVTNTIAPGDAGLAAAYLGAMYGDALVAIERNDPGPAAIRAITTERTDVTPYARIYSTENGKEGWLTSPGTRAAMWDEWHSALREAQQRDARGMMDALGAAEARTLVLKDGRPEAMAGAHDDVFVADAIAHQMRERVATDARPPAYSAPRSHEVERTVRDVWGDEQPVRHGPEWVAPRRRYE